MQKQPEAPAASSPVNQAFPNDPRFFSAAAKSPTSAGGAAAGQIAQSDVEISAPLYQNVGLAFAPHLDGANRSCPLCEYAAKHPAAAGAAGKAGKASRRDASLVTEDEKRWGVLHDVE